MCDALVVYALCCVQKGISSLFIAHSQQILFDIKKHVNPPNRIHLSHICNDKDCEACEHSDECAMAPRIHFFGYVCLPLHRVMGQSRLLRVLDLLTRT